VSFQLAPGTYTFTASAEINTGTGYIIVGNTSVTFNVKHTISAINDFGSGSINLEGATVSSGASAYKFIGDALSVGAIDQNDGAGYNRTWNASGTNNSNWLRKSMSASSFTNILGATSRNYSYTVVSNDNGATISADLRKIFNITFQNNMVGLGNTGIINVSETQYSSPSPIINVVQGNQITATAPTQEINGIDYSLSTWSNGSTSASTTFTPTDHSTYTASYIGKPDNSTRNLTFGTQLRRPITFTWTDNPNTNVTQYQIWRCTINKGIIQNLIQIGTVARGVQNYSDDEYMLTANNSSVIYYDARPYYSVEGTTADPDWAYVPAIIQDNESPRNNSLNRSSDIETVENYALDQNYPNPFNPSTIVNYQVPEKGFISLKVYDILGREVITLVNEVKTQGKYSVTFDEANLTSGVYIYQLKANGFSSTKKMILTK
jgi:hypothetical protein